MILVTGATGILGRVITLELLKLGKNVRAAKRISSNVDEVRRSFRFYTENPDTWFDRIEWVDMDFEDQESISRALEGVEEVYHCAAKVSFDPRESREVYHTNIDGTRNLLYAVDGSLVKKFLFVSSVAVLDLPNDKGEFDENSEYNPKTDHSAYAVSKHFAEMEVWRAMAEGLNAAIVNPGMIIGSGNWEQSSGNMFSTFAKYPFAFSGATSYVDVRDVAAISVKLMEKNILGERFIVVSESKTFEEMSNAVRTRLQRSKVKVIPDAVLKSLRFLKIFSFLFPQFKMLNRANIEAVTGHSRISGEKIRKRLEYRFLPVSESLDYHLNNYIQDQKHPIL